jgi:hypothetical protein
MTSDPRRGRSHEGVPQGDPLIEVTIRIYRARVAGARRGHQWAVRSVARRSAGVTPGHLRGRALTRAAVVPHAISVLLDDLDGSTTGGAK